MLPGMKFSITGTPNAHEPRVSVKEAAYKASANKIKTLVILIWNGPCICYLEWLKYVKRWGVQINDTRILILFADALYVGM